MQRLYSKILIGPLLVLLFVLFQNCKPADLVSAGVPTRTSDPNATESLSGNGTSYDGKPVIYTSQRRVSCSGVNQAEKTLSRDVSSGDWSLRTIKNLNGQCANSELVAVKGAEAFDVSQLAVLNGEYFDRVLSAGEAALDNHGVGTVCRVRGPAVAIGQSNFEGLVIYWDDQLQHWASRLDYGYISDGERFLSIGPLGVFQQFQEFLRFDSSSLFGPMIPSYYSRQKLLIDFARVGDTNSRDPDGFYDAILNYTFRVYNSAPPYVMTDVPLRCFVDVR